MLKKLIALFLCLLLVFSFAACKKDKDDIESSSKATTSDPTQDYENDQWDEGENLTEEEKEEIVVETSATNTVVLNENQNTEKEINEVAAIKQKYDRAYYARNNKR